MWARIINLVSGVWLMASSSVLGYAGAAKTNDVIVGACAASFAIIAMSEATRPVRWLNFALGAWLVVAGWVLGYEATAAAINSSVVGVLMILCASVRGKVESRFGGGWSSLWRSAQTGE